jgi:hypothetical protein
MPRTPATLKSRLRRTSSAAESPPAWASATCYIAEGTARMDNGRLLIWNPLYRVEPADAEKE